jgi:rubrerythrin
VPTTFNWDEIFEIAEQIERNGAGYYRYAAKNASDPEMKQRLLDLAIMEEGHEFTFRKLRQELSKREQPGQIEDIDGQAAAYLRALAGARVFKVHQDPSEQLSGNETEEQILEIAIGLEKDSVVFYQGMKDLVPEELGKDRVETIIKEEMGHILTLNDALERISNRGN